MTNLTKSKILLYRQCPKKLWLTVYRPDLVNPENQNNALLEMGTKVGEIARMQYPAGVLVSDQNYSEALEHTSTLINNKNIIFEAAFLASDVKVRADILVPSQSGYKLVEVKSSTEVKDYQIEDVAIQAWVIKEAGYELEQLLISVINNQFIYGGSGDYDGLFFDVNVGDEVTQVIQEVGDWVNEAKKILQSSSEPNERVGERCRKPFECNFISYCSPRLPEVEYPIEILPYGKKKIDELKRLGFNNLVDVPSELLSDPKHIRVHEVSRSGRSFLDEEAGNQIRALPFPRYYLDFETIAFAIPVWKDARPFMQIPFQWSCHIESANGEIQHSEFLDISGSDPRVGFIESLIDTIGSSGVVIVYNAAFEGARLNELANAYPVYSERLLNIKNRFFDLLPIARNYYYHPSMMGSWSIKKVLPTIAPELDYSKLEIGDGGMAQDAYVEAIDTHTQDDRKLHLSQEMLKYCKQDTLAMVKIAHAWS